MENEIINGCLWDWASSSDWLLTSEELYGLPKLFEQDRERYYYDQSWTPHCTIYSALWAVSDLWNYEFSQEEIDTLNEESYKKGRIRGEGRYVQSAVDLVCKYWNEKHPDKTVAYYRIRKRETDKIKQVLEKNYNLCTWFRGNIAYQKDHEDNGQIDNTNRWNPTYWHAVNVIKTDKRERAVKDNYKKRKTNVYGLIPTLWEMDNRHNGCYVIVKKEQEAIEERKRLEEFKGLAEDVVTRNSRIWNLTNNETLKEVLHKENELLRESLAYIYEHLW